MRMLDEKLNTKLEWHYRTQHLHMHILLQLFRVVLNVYTKPQEETMKYLNETFHN